MDGMGGMMLFMLIWGLVGLAVLVLTVIGIVWLARRRAQANNWRTRTRRRGSCVAAMPPANSTRTSTSVAAPALSHEGRHPGRAKVLSFRRQP